MYLMPSSYMAYMIHDKITCNFKVDSFCPVGVSRDTSKDYTFIGL